MNYFLFTKFKTKENGILNIEFKYFSFTFSSIIIEQIKDNKTNIYELEYDSDIFIKYIKEYMQKHIESWNEKYAFNGEDIVIRFFNERFTTPNE